MRFALNILSVELAPCWEYNRLRGILHLNKGCRFVTLSDALFLREMNFTLFSSTSSTYNRKEIQTDFGSNPCLSVFLAPKHTAVGCSIKKSSILSHHNSYKITLESQKHLAPDCLIPFSLRDCLSATKISISFSSLWKRLTRIEAETAKMKEVLWSVYAFFNWHSEQWPKTAAYQIISFNFPYFSFFLNFKSYQIFFLFLRAFLADSSLLNI